MQYIQPTIENTEDMEEMSKYFNVKICDSGCFYSSSPSGEVY